MRGTSYIRTFPAPVAASLALMAMSVVEKGLILITSPLYTRLLTQSEFGTVSVFISWQTLLGVVAMFCLHGGVFNNGMLDYEEDRDRYSWSLLVLSNIITLICFFALFALRPFLRTWFNLGLPLVCLMFAMFFTQPAFNFWTARQRFEYKYKLLAAVVIGSAFLSPLATVACILAFPGHRVYARLFGGESVLICVYCAYYFYLGKKAGWKVKFSYWKQAFLFNLPLIPHYLSGYALNSADRIMIANFAGDSAAARYSVAYTVALAATVVWNAINASLIPYTYEKCRKGDYAAIYNITNPIVLIYACLCGGLILIVPELIMIMAPSSYYEGIFIVPPIVGGVFFMSLYSVFANVVYYYRRPRYVMYASVSAATLNVILNYIFIPRFGYMAAAYTTLFCYIVQAALDYLALKKVTKASVCNMRLLLAFCAAMVAVSLFSGTLYYHNLLRYSLIALSVLAALLMRRRIVGAILAVRESN